MNYLFIGTYTKSMSKGIYVCRFDDSPDNLSVCSYCKVENPSYIAADPIKGYIYSVSENETGRSYANAFSFDAEEGKLTLINRRVTGGEGACHISVDPHGRFLVTANYGGKSISVFPIDKDGLLQPRSQNIIFDGKSVDEKRQEASHPHCTVFSPDGKYIFIADLGTDKIYRYDINYGRGKFIREDSRKDFEVDPGSGPRHIVFHPNGKYLYLVNELSGTVIAFAYTSGELKNMQEIPVKDERQQGGGAIVLSADGKKLFVSLREENDGIAVYGVGKNGRLIRQVFYNTRLHPRGICLSGDGKFLLVAAMKDNLVETWKVTRNGHMFKLQSELKINTPTFVGLYNFNFLGNYVQG